jgi:hypothetical protein
MNEYLLEIKYFVDELGLEDDDLSSPIQMLGFQYELKLQLPSPFLKNQASSSISLIHNGKNLYTRSLSAIESDLILKIVSKIKFSFNDTDFHGYGICPQDSYKISIKRGSCSMDFAWADGEYITNDKKLLATLTKLVDQITKIEPIDYLKLGIEEPEMKR